MPKSNGVLTVHSDNCIGRPAPNPSHPFPISMRLRAHKAKQPRVLFVTERAGFLNSGIATSRFVVPLRSDRPSAQRSVPPELSPAPPSFHANLFFAVGSIAALDRKPEPLAVRKRTSLLKFAIWLA